MALLAWTVTSLARRPFWRAAGRWSLAFLALTLTIAAPARADVALAPYKNKLFAYPAILGRNSDGSFFKVDYRAARDIGRRDSIPERRVRRRYVSLGVRRHERRRTIVEGGRSIPVDETGRSTGARFAVIFVHGRGGDRRLGSNDWSFGGNFNRLKNLAVANGGVYLAPSVSSFDEAGADTVAALIDTVARTAAPGAPVILSCASMGSFVCWALANRRTSVTKLSGLIVLGGAADPNFPRSVAYAASLPLMTAQGSDDNVYGWRRQKRLFDTIQSEQPAYPARFVLFSGGSHGTPIRMIDWRDTLNWMFRQQ